jgi:hypothetical protein
MKLGLLSFSLSFCTAFCIYQKDIIIAVPIKVNLPADSTWSGLLS